MLCLPIHSVIIRCLHSKGAIISRDRCLPNELLDLRPPNSPVINPTDYKTRGIIPQTRLKCRMRMIWCSDWFMCGLEWNRALLTTPFTRPWPLSSVKQVRPPSVRYWHRTFHRVLVSYRYSGQTYSAGTALIDSRPLSYSERGAPKRLAAILLHARHSGRAVGEVSRTLRPWINIRSIIPKSRQWPAVLLCPAPRYGALSDDARLTSVCLSRTSGLKVENREA